MLQDTPMCSVSSEIALANVLRSCSGIIIDEAVMLHKSCIEAVDRMLRDLMHTTNTPMGGKTILFSGDFCQILPVVKRGQRADSVNAVINTSELWVHIELHNLSHNFRAQNDHLDSDDTFSVHQYSQLLRRIGKGEIPIIADNFDIELPIEIGNGIILDSESKLIEAVYPELATNFTDHEWLTQRTILCSLNVVVNRINKLVLDLIPGQLKRYLSLDTVCCKDGTMSEEQAQMMYPVEYLNTIEVCGIPSHVVELKVGTPIMLIRSIETPRLLNGTRLIITALFEEVIAATLSIGPYAGDEVFIPRIPLTAADHDIPIQRLQFPVKLIYAMTTNKSQCQTFDTIGMHLEHDCFSHGQLYVSLSRVGNPGKIHVYNPRGRITSNVVYPEVFRNTVGY